MKPKTHTPLVSVLMTAYNAQRFIRSSVRSILDQTYSNLELIIIDDGSTDDTYKIAESYKNSDRRVRVIRLKKNEGPSTASNAGLAKVRGELIARMDADDIAMPDRIEKQVAYLLRHRHVVMVGGQCDIIDEEGRITGQKTFPISHKDIYTSLFSFNPIQHPACMIRTDTIRKHAIIYHNHTLLAHDLELVFEIAQYGKLANLSDTVLQYRCNHNSLSLRDPKETFWATVAVRNKAKKIYGYSPSLGGLATHYAQIFLMTFLPNAVIYELFQLIRIRHVYFQKIKPKLAVAWNNV